MSFNASWMGIRAGAKAEVLRRLDLFETGEIDFGTSRGLFCAEWPSGWLVFYGPTDLVTPDLLARASIDGEAIGCIASDVSMYSEALGYRAGRSEWVVSHNSEHGDRDLQISGSPPPVLAEIRDRLAKLQDADEEGGVDYFFEAPLELVKAICGYRLDSGDAPVNVIWKLVEPLYDGRAGREQVEWRERRDELTSRVERDIYPAAQAVGFARAIDHPEITEGKFPYGGTNAFFRPRGDAWETLRFEWGFAGETPFVNAFFFTYGDNAPRGDEGRVVFPGPRRSFLDILRGRNRPEPDTVESVVSRMCDVLPEIDLYLREGTPSPWIAPPRY